MEKIAYKPIRGAPRISLLITAVGVSLFLEYFLSLKACSSRLHRLPAALRGRGYDLWLVAITNIQLIFFSVTAASLLLLYLLVYRTKHGRAMRAVSHDKETASLMGINVDGTISFTFAVGTALAGSAAYSTVSPTRRSTSSWASCRA